MTPEPLLAPSMLATDLRYHDLPPWLRLAWVADRRKPISTEKLERWTWHTWHRIALDHSRLPMVPRTVARILVDYHGTESLTVEVGAVRLAPRLPAHPDHVLRAIVALEDSGWLAVQRRPGLVPILTLLCPVDEPVDPRATRGTNPRATRGTPRATRGTPPRHARDNGAKGQRGKPTGHARGTVRDETRDGDQFIGFLL